MTGAATTVAGRLADVRERIARAASAAGRPPEAVTLIAVSKEQPVAAILAALEAGQHLYGENRAQDLVAKARELGATDPRPSWHFVGRLQRNKVRMLAPHIEMWHSIDRADLVSPLARYAPGARVFVQVNVAGDVQKAGCAPEEAAELVDRLHAEALAVVGLMTVPPEGVDPRPSYSTLRELAQRLGVPELSMGMTDDFETAIDEGATFIRVGSAVFGPRRGANVLRR